MRNPDWYRDELILALDLYMQNPSAPAGKTSAAVIALSDTLNSLGSRLGIRHEADYRNPNGVYMKMMNFRRFDPLFTASGKVGLTRGNKLEEVIWKEFASEPDNLQKTAKAIRKAVSTGLDDDIFGDMDEAIGITEAPEGRLLTRMHQTRERNKTLVAAAKTRALKTLGTLSCEACSFDFGKAYGPHGDGFIEVHHCKPVHTLVEGSKTKLEDLALLCANCHRVLHRRTPWLTVEEVRNLWLTTSQ